MVLVTETESEDTVSPLDQSGLHISGLIMGGKSFLSVIKEIPSENQDLNAVQTLFYNESEGGARQRPWPEIEQDSNYPNIITLDSNLISVKLKQSISVFGLVEFLHFLSWLW